MAESDEWEPKPCGGLSDTFFSDDPSDIAVAKSICSGCKHGVWCAGEALAALANGEKGGVWAGMTLAELEEGLANADRNRALTAGHPSSLGRADALSDLRDAPDDAGGDVRRVSDGAGPPTVA